MKVVLSWLVIMKLSCSGFRVQWIDVSACAVHATLFLSACDMCHGFPGIAVAVPHPGTITCRMNGVPSEPMLQHAGRRGMLQAALFLVMKIWHRC